MMNELYFSLQQNFYAELKTAVSWNTSIKQAFVGGVGEPDKALFSTDCVCALLAHRLYLTVKTLSLSRTS